MIKPVVLDAFCDYAPSTQFLAAAPSDGGILRHVASGEDARRLKEARSTRKHSKMRIEGDATATATAKSLQACPTLCDPVPGILQARTLEWVATSFSSA